MDGVRRISHRDECGDLRLRSRELTCNVYSIIMFPQRIFTMQAWLFEPFVKTYPIALY